MKARAIIRLSSIL